MDETAEIIQFPTPPAFLDLLQSYKQLERLHEAEKIGHEEAITDQFAYMKFVSWIGYCPAIRAKAQVVCAYTKQARARSRKRKAG
jgi:hypothetical protein